MKSYIHHLLLKSSSARHWHGCSSELVTYTREYINIDLNWMTISAKMKEVIVDHYESEVYQDNMKTRIKLTLLNHW